MFCYWCKIFSHLKISMMWIWVSMKACFFLKESTVSIQPNLFLRTSELSWHPFYEPFISYFLLLKLACLSLVTVTFRALYFSSKALFRASSTFTLPSFLAELSSMQDATSSSRVQWTSFWPTCSTSSPGTTMDIPRWLWRTMRSMQRQNSTIVLYRRKI